MAPCTTASPSPSRSSSLLLSLALLALLAPRAAVAQLSGVTGLYAAGSTAYQLGGANGFQPTSIVALRLSHPAIQNRSFSLTAAVFLDEFAAPTDPNAPLTLLQSVAVPSTTPSVAGQMRLT